MAAPATQAYDCTAICPDVPITNVPGPAGAAGAAGTNGTNGTNAFTTTSAGFTQPAVAATVVVTVVTSAFAVIGQVLYVQNGGYYTVTAITDSTHLTLSNLGYSGNAAPAAVIGSGQRVGPGGLAGGAGGTGLGTLNSISPSTTRGDLLVDNGALSPAASDVRLGVGTDGQILTAESSQPTGLLWQSVHPNASATTDNQLARYNTPAGTEEPAAIQTSSIKLTDNGALQHTGGNAKGTDAVDLQPSRAVVTQVASGANSGVLSGLNNTASGARSVVAGGTTNVASTADATIGGGTGNTVSGATSTVGGGTTNIASGAQDTVGGGSTNTASGGNSTIGGGAGNIASGLNSTVGGGLTNTASNSRAVVAGGNTNIASGSSSFVGGGDQNTASAQQSCVLGGTTNTASERLAAIIGGGSAKADKFGQVAHASDAFAAAGDAQVSELIWRVTTTDGTVGVEAYLDGVSATKRASIAVGSSWGFQILAIGRSSAGVTAAWKAEGCIQNNGGTTGLVGGAITPVVIADGTGGTWGVAAGIQVTADNANDSLKIGVTGAAATNIRWVITAKMVEVSYP